MARAGASTRTVRVIDSVLAHTVCAALRRRLPGYATATPDTLHRHRLPHPRRRRLVHGRQPALPEPEPAQPTAPNAKDAQATTAEPATAEPATAEPAGTEPVDSEPVAAFTGTSRVSTGTFLCRYAGAMLLHAYLDRVGAEAIFATLAGGPARRYDDLAVLSTATLGFALGIDTVEGAKHLRRAEAGVALGLTATPQLATFRARLSALADGSDPLAVQRAFAARMLAAYPLGDPVYFVDDHFVPYAGARPVAKGWNTKRRHAGPGREDTLLVDARGRAVVFGSGEPTGLSTSLPGVLAQLYDGDRPHAPVLLGFDRGGAYPVTFTACRDAGPDWVTYRRAPLADTTATPRRSWTVRDGKRVIVVLADETVQLKGYGQARQLTLFEHDQPVLQVLTSDTHATGADLLCWLRSRWRIENMFKYVFEHNGIDALADYRMDTAPDTLGMLPNPARARIPRPGQTAEAELAAAERALPQLLNGEGHPENRRTPRCPARTDGFRAGPGRAGRRAGCAQADPGQDRRVRAGPGRETSPPAAWPAAACRWCCGCSRSTPKPGLPSASTPTWPIPTNTARSPATYSTSAGRSSTTPPGSPSPWTGPTRPGSPAPSPCSPTS